MKNSLIIVLVTLVLVCSTFGQAGAQDSCPSGTVTSASGFTCPPGSCDLAGAICEPRNFLPGPFELVRQFCGCEQEEGRPTPPKCCHLQVDSQTGGQNIVEAVGDCGATDSDCAEGDQCNVSTSVIVIDGFAFIFIEAGCTTSSPQ
jgi:hypothetical protein